MWLCLIMLVSAEVFFKTNNQFTDQISEARMRGIEIYLENRVSLKGSGEEYETE